MYSITLTRITRKVLALVACTGAVLALTAGPVSAAHNKTLTITEASWDGSTLTIKGKGESGFPVDASNASSPFQALGSDTPSKNGRYLITNSDGSSSTVCRVHVEQDDGVEFAIAELDVTGNAYCDDPPPANDPPVCVIDSPASDVSILVGDSVSYAGTATDIDGVIQSTDWTFDGGTPSTSTAEDPGPVTYNTAGTYNTTFDATDDDGASCSPAATRTITVNEPGTPDPLPIQTDFKMMMNYELGMHCTGFEFAYCCVLPVYNSILAQVVKPQNGINTPHLLEADPNANTDADVLGRHTVVRDYSMDGDGNFNKYVLRYWHDAQPRDDGNGKAQASTKISAVEGNSLLSWNTVADSAHIVGSTGDCDRGAMLSGDYNGSSGVVLGDGDYTDHGCTFGKPIDNYQNVVWNHLYIYEVSARGVEGYKPNNNSLEADKHRLGLHVDYPTNYGPAGHKMEGLLTFSGEHGTVVYTQMKVLEDLPITLTSPRIWEALGLPLTAFEDTIDFFGDPGLVDEDSIRPYVEMKARLHHADCVGDVCTEGAAVLDNQGNEVVGFGTAPIDIPNCERCHSAFDTPNSPNITGTAEAALVQQEINFWNAYYNIDTGAGDSDWYSRLKGAGISILAMHDAEHGTGFVSGYPGTGALRPSTCTAPVVNEGNACVLHATCDTVPGAGDGQCDLPQNTRIGHESVICQKCHADNVIAVVKSAYCGPGVDNLGQGCDVNDPRNQLFSNIAPGSMLIKPLTEALHWNHRETSEGGTITMTDASGRSGGCQGCHPAHRSDGDMAGYPIDLDGNNFYADLDNRDANGGCFVGRDVHSNPAKDIDGAETPSHLNPVGQWLQANVANDSGSWKGVWCTNCHSQAGQQMWKAENVADLVNAQPGDAGHVREPFAGAGLSDVVAAVNAALGTTTTDQEFIDWLDPADPAMHPGRTVNQNSAIWAPDPGMCDHVASLFGAEPSAAHDGNVATIEVAIGAADGTGCSTGIGLPGPNCGLVPDGSIPGGADFFICGSVDGDGDVSVSIQDFCTTPDCVAAAQQGLADGGFTTAAVPVPMSAATDGRDHWLAPGEPHCADCHAAPYVEQSGNIDAFAPFNYPRKASLMRYSRGHQDITCQGCHESTHGLYPVTPLIDTTSYAQAASLNHDNSHGPLKCGTCHDVGSDGIPTWMSGMEYLGQPIGNDYDAAVSWMHTYTLEASPLEPGGVCENCHGVKGNNWDVVGEGNKKWVQHTYRNRASRSAMDKVELEIQGYLSGDLSDPDNVDQIAPEDGVCQQCHRDRTNKLNCGSSKWKNHLLEGRVAESVWEEVSTRLAGSTCGW